MAQLTILNDDDDNFPSVDQALDNGLLAAGGTLNQSRLIRAYQQGIFPWYNQGEPVMWWSPNPRCVIYTNQFHVSRSFARALKRQTLKVTLNHAFRQVMTQCSLPRDYECETWINPEMIEAYCELNRTGEAHSIEVWHDKELVGGVYGVFTGRVFCGESMFSRVSNGSKTALYALSIWLNKRGIELIDCQIPNSHLLSLGAQEIPRSDFLLHLGSIGASCHTEINWSPQELAYD